MSQTFEQRFFELRRAVLEKRFCKMNEKQREAVFRTEGPVLILAGAGSGKTTVVVNRIANMVEFGNAYHSDYCPSWVGEEELCFLEDWLDGKLDDGDITNERLHRIVADCPIKPWNILAITFTNKAAGELKERLEAMLRAGAGHPGIHLPLGVYAHPASGDWSLGLREQLYCL